jgi:hypothetical protein
MGGACSTQGRYEKCIGLHIFVGKSDGKRSLVGPKDRWKDNINKGHIETRCGVVKTGMKFGFYKRRGILDRL